MSKGGAGSGRYPKGSGGDKELAGEKVPTSTPAKRKLSPEEAFHYYVKVKQGDFGNGLTAKLLNSKVGRCEGMAKAYREKAGKLPKGDEQTTLLNKADALYSRAQKYASERDSYLGRPAYKFVKFEGYTPDQIDDLINSGEFSDQELSDIEQDTGLDLSEFRDNYDYDEDAITKGAPLGNKNAAKDGSCNDAISCCLRSSGTCSGSSNSAGGSNIFAATTRICRRY